MLRNNQQNRILHTLLTKHGIDNDTKKEMVMTVTKGREKSSAKLTMEECQSLINSLNANQHTPRPNYTDKYKDDPEDKQRKKIISICYEMRWTLDKQIDWKRLNTWLLKYGIHHKVLNDLSETELPATITQFEELLKHFYAKR